MEYKSVFMLIILGLFTSIAFSQADYEIRGPKRDGVYPNEKLLKEWPEQGPDLIKTIDGIGEGFTLPAVTNDRIYLTGMIDTIGYLSAYGLDGNLLWQKKYGQEWTANFPGSRSTPTIVGDKIYFCDSFGKVLCYDKSGKLVWKLDMKKEFGFRNLTYGANESLLVDGDKLYCTPGGNDVMIAVLNRHTGQVLNKIKGNGQKSAHCSPVLIDHKGKRILLTMTAQGLVGVDLKQNKMIFENSLSNSWEGNPNPPMYIDGYIFISTQEGGSKLLKLSDDGLSLTEVWANKAYDSENEGAIILNDHVYLGAYEKKKFYCFELKTGKLKYFDTKTIGRANVVFADGLIYSYNAKGYVNLIKPNSEKLEVISRFKMKQGTKQHISHPVIKDGRLYIRRGNAMNIYDIARK